MWTNFEQADWVLSNPPVITENVERNSGAGLEGATATEIFADAMGMPSFAGGARSGTQVRIIRHDRASVERERAHVAHSAAMDGNGPRRVPTVSETGDDAFVERFHSWQSNQYQVPAGRRLSRPQMPASNAAAIEAAEKRWFENVCIAFGIPPDYLTRSRSSHNSAREGARNADTKQLRSAVKDARAAMSEFISKVFEDVYRAEYDELIYERYVDTRDEDLRRANALRHRMRIVWRVDPVSDIEQLVSLYSEHHLIGPHIMRRYLPPAIGLLDA
jgi:hypothetical protein